MANRLSTSSKSEVLQLKKPAISSFCLSVTEVKYLLHFISIIFIFIYDLIIWCPCYIRNIAINIYFVSKSQSKVLQLQIPAISSFCLWVTEMKYLLHFISLIYIFIVWCPCYIRNIVFNIYFVSKFESMH